MYFGNYANGCKDNRKWDGAWRMSEEMEKGREGEWEHEEKRQPTASQKLKECYCIRTFLHIHLYSQLMERELHSFHHLFFYFVSFQCLCKSGDTIVASLLWSWFSSLRLLFLFCGWPFAKVTKTQSSCLCFFLSLLLINIHIFFSRLVNALDEI